MRVKILGKVWNLRFTHLRGDYDGECDPPDRRDKEIRIHSKLSEQDELETLIHEIWHAADWHKKEDYIEEVARDMARILIRLGWRRSD